MNLCAREGGKQPAERWSPAEGRRPAQETAELVVPLLSTLTRRWLHPELQHIFTTHLRTLL